MFRIICALVLVLAGLTPADEMKQKDVSVQGMTVIFGSIGTVQIEPLEVLNGKSSGVLKDEAPSWRGPERLSAVGWVYNGMKSGSLTITTDDEAKKVLAEGVDFSLDSAWATFGRRPQSTIPAGTKVVCTYTFTQSRIDLVEISGDGKLVVKKGKSSLRSPRLPDSSDGATPLASVYLRHNTTQLDPKDVMLIDPAYKGVPPVIDSNLLNDIRQKIKTDKPMVIAFLGDSITAMGDKDLGERGNFVDRFAKKLQTALPARRITQTSRDKIIQPGANEIVIVKAGVGGDDTNRGLKRIDKDVIAHKPDLVLIMFGVNDENGSGKKNSVPTDVYAKNLTTMVTKLHEVGSTVVLMTPSMKNLNWSATVGNLDEYAQTMRDVAKKQKLAVIDHFSAWEQLPKTGYDYMIYLDSGINHPGDLGHELFLKGVEQALLTP